MKLTKLLIGLVAFSSLAGAAHAVTINVGATASVFPNLAVEQTRAISFGSFTAPSTGEPGTVTTSGDITVVSAGMIKNTNGGVGKFMITGQSGATVDIAVDDQVILASNGNNLTAVLTGDQTDLALGAGSATFEVEGVLTVPVNAPPGNYAGTYNISVNY